MKKIYIVEDNPDIGFILGYFLKEEGFDVSLFATVKEFKEGLTLGPPDIFLLDVMLPDGDGVVLCDQLKDNSSTLHIPVIIMSAHANIEKIGRENRANDVIHKPFDLDVMLSKINEQLDVA
jgi:DNA-binding response OmpR family regulator